jgi:hypothetical protein
MIRSAAITSSMVLTSRRHQAAGAVEARHAERLAGGRPRSGSNRMPQMFTVSARAETK